MHELHGLKARFDASPDNKLSVSQLIDLVDADAGRGAGGILHREALRVTDQLILKVRSQRANNP